MVWLRYIFAILVFAMSGGLSAQTSIMRSPYASAHENWRAKCIALERGTDPAVVLDSGLIAVQYYDGLGRNIQEQTFCSGHTGFSHSSITSRILDSSGRPMKTLLPVASSNSGEKADWAELCALMQEPQACFTSTEYEHNQLGRVLRVTRPGAYRRNAGKSINYEYTCNKTDKTSEYYCPRLTVQNNKIKTFQTWKEGDLSVCVTIDEDGEKSYTFNDARGLTLLTRIVTSTGRREDTMYLYDYAGRLLYILPPGMSAKILKGETIDLQTSDADCIFSYRYDSRERPIEMRMPSAGIIRTAYTPMSQTALWQNATMASSGMVFRNAYDELGRKAYVSLHPAPANAFTALHIKSSVQYLGENNTRRYGYSRPEGMDDSYKEDILSVDYYDDYSFLEIFADYADSLAYRQISGYDLKASSALKRKTGTAQRIIGPTSITDEWKVSAYYYDDKGRLIQTVSTNPLGGYDRISLALSFDGRVRKSIHYHCTPDTLLIREREYSYDAQLQISAVTMQTNGGEKITLISSEYDPRGWVTSQTLLNDDVPISYDYTDAGELVRITSVPFSQTMYRCEPVGYGDISNRLPLYNDRISGETFTLKDFDTTSPNRNNSSRFLAGAYAYSYEGLRLTEAKYTELSRSIKESNLALYHTYKFTNPNYSVSISYNEDGLPVNIQRYGLSDIVNGTSSSDSNIQLPNSTEYIYNKVDNLTLKYLTGKLNRVDDSSDADCTLSIATDFNEKVQRDDEYSYDACGRLINDRNKGISISYNVLGLPSEIKDFTCSIRYTYTADGTLLKTEYGTHVKEAIFIRPGQILLSDVFHLQEASIKVGEVEYSDSIISRVWNEAGWTDSSGRYVAAIRDRHGSLRATYTRPFQSTGNSVGSGIGISRPLTQGKTFGNLTAYYPGGLPFADWQGDDKYLFCGKEMERYMGLLTYDFHARSYDPQLGLFLTTDPYAGSYPNQSPYIYCTGNPISLTDPTGCKISTDLIGNTDREKFETLIYDCNRSQMFSTLYQLIDLHPTKIQLANGSTRKHNNHPNYFDAKQNIIYLDFDNMQYDESGTYISVADVYATIEEMYHSYQHLYSDIDDHTRNPEFEAKSIGTAIMKDITIKWNDVPMCWTPCESNFFDQMDAEYNILTVDYVMSANFRNAYLSGGRKFINYFKDLKHNNESYKIPYAYDWPVTFVPYTLINFIKTYNENYK